LARAADTDPNYKIPYRVPAGVLGYLGRAYLETGRDNEARQTLERAVSLAPDDPFAHLYLGIALLKTGERDRGRSEVENGLRAIDGTLEHISQDLVYGYFWDPNMEIRNDIRKNIRPPNWTTRSLLWQPSASEISSTRRIDKARRDESRRYGGGGDGGGGGS
jgi:tetratricopeptide (TPR) repeat protein